MYVTVKELSEVPIYRHRLQLIETVAKTGGQASLADISLIPSLGAERALEYGLMLNVAGIVDFAFGCASWCAGVLKAALDTENYQRLIKDYNAQKPGEPPLLNPDELNSVGVLIRAKNAYKKSIRNRNNASIEWIMDCSLDVKSELLFSVQSSFYGASWLPEGEGLKQAMTAKIAECFKAGEWAD